MIVEEEQHGANRAAYGSQLLKELSAYLTKNFGKGFSVGNLKNIRQFYRVYSEDQIGETVFSQFGNLPAVSTGRKFYLSWSHYLKLMRIDNIEERHFYEIESVKNDWSLSELNGSTTAPSMSGWHSARIRTRLPAGAGRANRRISEGCRERSYVLEFLGLPELPSYSETELESRIIDHLQQISLGAGNRLCLYRAQERFTFDEEHFMVDWSSITGCCAALSFLT